MRLILSIVVLLVGVNPVFAEGLRVEPLAIETRGGRVEISAEIADTPESRQRGLMFRQSLGLHEGMLFDFKRVQPVSFWMKNTSLYLDMLFIDETGEITGIIANAEPYTTTNRRSPGPVLAVLELIGRAADKLGIAIGDRVHHPIFSE